MTRTERIDRFERLGLGLFVHYGLFSAAEAGEWYLAASGLSDAEYTRLMEGFLPKKSWAEEIADFAVRNGFRYAVLTARHHDGFSLYDTRGLSSFDAAHLTPPRDLVREFAEACRARGLLPFFYHTLIDWREEKRFAGFHDYLAYLRRSVELLCTQYGPIGGLWFDGQWKYPDRDWELDALYGRIRVLQPDAIIVSNSGLQNLGAKTHEEIDAVTFERSGMERFDRRAAAGLYSAELCQSLNGHWGFARRDISYKSVEELLEHLCVCRSKRCNYLLNIGPEPDGSIREMDRAVINLLGQWVRTNAEALYDVEPFGEEQDGAFALRGDSAVYVFFPRVPMEIDPNAGHFSKNDTRFYLPEGTRLQSAEWLDDGSPVRICRDSRGCCLQPAAFPYGTSMLVRVAKCSIAQPARESRVG